MKLRLCIDKGAVAILLPVYVVGLGLGIYMLMNISAPGFNRYWWYPLILIVLSLMGIFTALTTGEKK